MPVLPAIGRLPAGRQHAAVPLNTPFWISAAVRATTADIAFLPSTVPRKSSLPVRSSTRSMNVGEW